MANNVTQHFFESDTLMSDKNQLTSPLINSPYGISQFNFDSAPSPNTPFFFPNLTPSLNPTSPPAGLSLVLPQVSNSYDQPKNILFSSNLNFNALPISGTPEIFQVNQEFEPMQPPILMSGPLTAQDIMLSEEYTCVRVFNGPNPRVTHIFRDHVLHSHPIDELTGPSFLNNCFMCKNAPKKDKDIHLFRGMVFCSEECRSLEMWLDYEEEKAKKAEEASDDNSRDSSNPSSTSQEAVFFIGDVPKSQSW